MSRTWMPVVLAACLSCPAVVGQSQTAQQKAAAAMARGSGRNMTPQQAEKLEAQVAADPDDLTARTRLLEYYMMRQYRSPDDRAARERHVLWIIEHQPEAEVAGEPEGSLDRILNPAAYGKASDLWRKQVKENPKNVTIISHAARFFTLHDRPTAESLYQQAIALEPDNPAWPQRLAHLYGLDSLHRDQVNIVMARKSLAAYKQALEKVTRSRRASVLTDAAKMAVRAEAWKEAKDYATEVLDAAMEGSASWNFANAIHDGNMVLGLVALHDGNVGQAEKYLLQAGKSTGSPQLSSFGPNMTLAKALLEKGRQEAVIDYLELCGKFWTKSKTDEWIGVIKAGQVPDFGANLRY